MMIVGSSVHLVHRVHPVIIDKRAKAHDIARSAAAGALQKLDDLREICGLTVVVFGIAAKESRSASVELISPNRRVDGSAQTISLKRDYEMNRRTSSGCPDVPRQRVAA
jgi:hypothetical protein